MPYDLDRVTTAFSRLFLTYPQFQANGDFAVVMGVYFDAVKPYETLDIEAGVENFITGYAPGHSPGWAPPAPQIAVEVKRVRDIRLRTAALGRKPELPPPLIVHPSDSNARVQAMVDQFADDHSSENEETYWQYGELPPLGGRPRGP